MSYTPSSRKAFWVTPVLVAAAAVLGAAFLLHSRWPFGSEKQPVACLDYVRHSGSLALRRHLTDEPCNPASGVCASRDSIDTVEIKAITPLSGAPAAAELSGYLLSHQAFSARVQGTSMTFSLNEDLRARATCYPAGIKGTMQTTSSARYPHTWSIELSPKS